MMPDSTKAADLRRDPRFALHAAPVDLELVDGDAKINGRAIEVTDPADIERFVAGLDEAPPPSGVGLFRTELTDAVAHPRRGRLARDRLVARGRRTEAATASVTHVTRLPRRSRRSGDEVRSVRIVTSFPLGLLPSAGVGTREAMAEPAVGTGVRRWWHSRFGASFARELFLITALLLFYKYGRSLVSGESTKAVDHAANVIGDGARPAHLHRGTAPTGGHRHGRHRRVAPQLVLPPRPHRGDRRRRSSGSTCAIRRPTCGSGG